jgi:Flp pilus assembly pilin Flp
MHHLLQRIRRTERGATAVEYALMLVAILVSVGPTIANKLPG